MHDPFDQLYGLDHRDGVDEIANVSVIDSNTLGNDNRSVMFTNPYLRTASTDADGKATVTISMSLQPGDGKNPKTGKTGDSHEWHCRGF